MGGKGKGRLAEDKKKKDIYIIRDNEGEKKKKKKKKKIYNLPIAPGTPLFLYGF